MEAGDDNREALAKIIANSIKNTLNKFFEDEDAFVAFMVAWRPVQMVGYSTYKEENKKFLDGEGNTIYMSIAPGLKGTDFIPIAGNISQTKRSINQQKLIKEKYSKYSATMLSNLKNATKKNISISLESYGGSWSVFKITVK